ncbi:unnamed protein product [Orchesella dallaii]|uniref:Protein kinase C-binding protein 1 n=1 Tax=Orchesella dallaii TaxID=48710 RepID=A0ABP1S5M4_9HEXA
MAEGESSNMSMDMETSDDDQTQWSDPSVMFGPRCWKCFIPKTFFTCKNCGKCYHRKCALMYEGFPSPVFEKKSLQDAMIEETPTPILMCSECIVAEQTRVPDLVNVPRSSFNSAAMRIALNIEEAFDLADLKPSNGGKEEDVEGQRECLEMIGNAYTGIRKKASGNEYISLEGLYCDYKNIRYNIVVKFGRCSQQFIAVQSLIRVTKELVNELLTCPTCYIMRINDVNSKQKGQIKPEKQVARVMTETCEKPHLVIWIKMPRFPYWPAKLLQMDDKKETAVLVCFNENKFWNVRLDVVGNDIKIYSSKCLSKSGNDRLATAIKDCNNYLNNAKKAFGRVVIPEEAGNYGGDLDKALKEMYPDFKLED